jgi:transcriptional regulator with XRE-family HTH domain
MYSIDLETLGERIRHIREARGNTQQQISYLLNLGDPKTVGRWENGKQQPKPEYIQELARVLNISYAEEMYWLGLAGYIPPTRMPKKQQIIPVLEMFYQDIAAHPYPAYFLDFRANFWAVNPASVGLFKDYDQTVELLKGFTNLLDLMFDSRIGFSNRIVNPNALRRGQLSRFIAQRLNQRHEQYWKEYPECFKDRWPEADYKLFEALWHGMNLETVEAERFSEDAVKAMFGYLPFCAPDGTRIEFKLVSQFVLYFSNQFKLVVYYPSTDEDKHKADAHFSRFNQLDQTSLKLWNLRNIDDILKQFE